MEILFLFLSYLIYINAIDNNTLNIYNLSLFGRISYKDKTKSYTILNLDGNELKKIYITYTIPNKFFSNSVLNYSFSNEYPNDSIITNLQIEKEQEKISSIVLENNIRKYEIKLYYNIPKEENQKYLLLSNFENIFNDSIIVEHIKNNSTTKTLTIIFIVVGVITIIAILIVVGKFVYIKKHDDLLKKEYGSSFVAEKENPSVIPPEDSDSPQENNKNEEQQLL
jgi:hypothetical protein